MQGLLDSLIFLPHLSLFLSPLSLTHTQSPNMQSPYQDGPQAANPSPQMLAGSVEKVRVNDRDYMY